jgi:hypothetical protein
MANHNLPTQTSAYIDFVSQMDYRYDDLARGLDPATSPVGDPTISNLPVNSVGWSSGNNNWRKWNGSTWVDLATSQLYSINISGNAGTVTGGVYTTGDQTIAGTKTFSSAIAANITGNAATVTNGVYTTGTQTIAGVKTFSSSIVGNISTATGLSATLAVTSGGTGLTSSGFAGNILTSTGTALQSGGGAATSPSVVAFSATAMTMNCLLSNVFSTTFTGNVTTAPTLSNPINGQTINWFITQDATGNRTITWPSSFRWSGGLVQTLSTGANAVDLLVITYRSTTGLWYASLSKGFA